VSTGRDNASGFAAGITIVAATLLGAGLGYALGALLDVALLLTPIGAAVGLVFGFYAVYVRFIK
jgi:F0F1-type ATP synthase assembly protein I